jgi:hypothetical protein
MASPIANSGNRIDPSNDHHDEPNGIKINEQTSLLGAIRTTPYNHGTISPDDALADSKLTGNEIDPNATHAILSHSQSYNTGLGLKLQSQENAMLRDPPGYGNVEGISSSFASQRPLLSNAEDENDENLEEGAETGEESPRKSPFLAGVSVGRFWLIFGGILVNHFLACFDSTIMFSSHPVITSHFHSSNSASWLSTAFLLTSTGFQPLFGRLSDTIGRKPPYIFNLVVFLVSTIWCACATTMTSFILARALCGLGAGGMMSLGSIITSDLVPIEIRGVYQSYMNIVYGAGSALGAALGGAIADHLGWRWEFGVQVPGILISIILATITVPETLGLDKGVEKKTIWEAMKVFDFKGSFLLTTSITCLIFGIVRTQFSLVEIHSSDCSSITRINTQSFITFSTLSDLKQKLRPLEPWW